jgi:phage shock protein E
MNIEEIIKLNDALIVDVRTPSEFQGGNVAGSINIPLNEIPSRLDEFKHNPHIVLCCASGGRSGQATAYLQQCGINCVNGGAWTSVNYYKNI